MIYLDSAATTPIHPDVLCEMEPYLREHYGNPSSIHAPGRAARAGVDQARARLARFVGCRPDEIVFTSGGTESIHSALLGVFLARGLCGHIVTTAVEHHAVLHTCALIESLGGEVTYVRPGRDSVVRPEDVLAAMRPDTILVSVMAVNNELGTINPVSDIAQAVKQKAETVTFHSDMVQALGTLRFELATSGIDLASFSAHKIYGPKGVGALFVRRGTVWSPVLRGGAQEGQRRAGTENVAGIVGFGAAAARLEREWDAHITHLHKLSAAFCEELASVPGMERNSPPQAVPAIVNLAFAGVRNETLLMRLDLEGVAASAGSACTAGALDPSHVLLACGFPEERVNQSLRFSFSDFITVSDALRAAAIVATSVAQLRTVPRL